MNPQIHDPMIRDLNFFYRDPLHSLHFVNVRDTCSECLSLITGIGCKLLVADDFLLRGCIPNP